MQNAKIFWVETTATRGRPGFAWKWRAENGASESARGFTYFLECIEDARRHGYQPRIDT